MKEIRVCVECGIKFKCKPGWRSKICQAQLCRNSRKLTQIERKREYDKQRKYYNQLANKLVNCL